MEQSQDLVSVNGRGPMCRNTARSTHNSYREESNRKSGIFMLPHHFKEESNGAFFRSADQPQLLPK